MSQPKHCTISPNSVAIKQHLEFLFSNMNGFDDGKIEISRLVQSNTFSLDEQEDAVKQALTWNNSNVYLVGSLLNPDGNTGENGRSLDSDFYASSVIWCDIDDPIDPEKLKFLYDHCPPNVAVVTAREPTRRVQLWWKLDRPLDEPDTLRLALQGVQQLLGGDPKVTNPTSLMRVGGSINWPTEKKKAKGRVDEVTEYKVIHNNTVTIDAFLMAYPVPEPFASEVIKTEQSQARQYSTSALGLEPERVVDGREAYMSSMVYAAIINLAGENGAWPTPQEVFDDTWPVYSRKVKEREGRTLDQDGRGQKALIQKIKSKLRLFTHGRIKAAPSVEYIVANRPKKVDEITHVKKSNDNISHIPKNGIKATDILDIDLDKIPPREFLYSNIVGRKYVTMIVAPAGAGKSILTLSMAISAASGKPWGKWSTPQGFPINVWVYNNEEGFDELRRRIRAVMIDMEIKKEDITGKLYVDSGENRAIRIAGLDKDSNVIYTPDYEALKQEVIDRKIDLLIIDPFAETYSVNENSNDHIKRVTALYRNIAIECNCAVLLVHHTRKGMEGANGTQAGNADMARGGGAQIGVVRRAFTLTHMDDKEAKKLGVPKEEKRWYVRMDDAKSNITAPADVITWLRLKSVRIGNATKLFSEGDSVGVLNHVEADAIIAKFAGLNGQESEKMVEEVARYMQQKALSEVSLTEVSKHIFDQQVFTYSERVLRERIGDAVENHPAHVPVMAEGVLAFIAMSDEKRERNIRIIVRKIDHDL